MKIKLLLSFLPALSLLLAVFWRPAEAAPTVGVYYYPWYGSFSGGHRWSQSVRGHLAPPQPPSIGDYSSRDAATIASHIDQSHKGNIDFWALSWWGPQSAEDVTIGNSILGHPRRAELKYAIHYESPGRLGSFDNPNFSNLIPDFRYLANTYFDNPNYLEIDGRPVVFMYVTRAYFNSQASRDAVADLRATMMTEFGVDPYIVGDDLFSGGVNLQRAQLWDAVTDFDVYGSVMQSKGSTMAALNQLAALYDGARNTLAPTDVAFIPTASPGFNDTGVRNGHPAAPRYMTDDPESVEGDLFSRMMNQVVVPRTDERVDHILMINSFNEWHEDTQIEPTIVAPRTNLDDSGTQQYTEGHHYEGYGELYLNILRSATVLAGDFDNSGSVDAADYVLWRKSLGQSGPGFVADGDHNHVVDADDYEIWRANFGRAIEASRNTMKSVSFETVAPEPSAWLLSAMGFSVVISLREMISARGPNGLHFFRQTDALPGYPIITRGRFAGSRSAR